MKGIWVKAGSFIFTTEHPPRLIAEVHKANIGLEAATANAWLIASAPDMYRALKAVYERMEKRDRINQALDGEPTHDELLEQVSTALAKAGGKVK